MLSRHAHRLAVVAHLALIAGLVAWSPTPLGVLAAALLLAPLPGIVRARTYTCGWASMMVTIYCAMLLADGYARPDGRLWAFLLAALAAADFVGLVLFVRLSGRERLARTAASGGASH